MILHIGAPGTINIHEEPTMPHWKLPGTLDILSTQTSYNSKQRRVLGTGEVPSTLNISLTHTQNVFKELRALGT